MQSCQNAEVSISTFEKFGCQPNLKNKYKKNHWFIRPYASYLQDVLTAIQTQLQKEVQLALVNRRFEICSL